MPLGAPYRQPCVPWVTPPVAILGPSWQNNDPTEDGITEMGNVTQMLDPSVGSPTDPDDCIAPAPIVDCGFGSPPCVSGDDGPTLCAAVGGETPFYDNLYLATGGPALNFSMCRKLGYKNLIPAKTWHGRFGFDSPGVGSCDDTASPPDTTRYLTQTMEGTSTHSLVGPSVAQSEGVCTRGYSVARLTGIRTETERTDSMHYDVGSGVDYDGNLRDALQMDFQCGQWVGNGVGISDGIAAALNDSGTPTSYSTGYRGFVIESKSHSSTILSFVVSEYSSGTGGSEATKDTYSCTITLSDIYQSNHDGTHNNVNDDCNGLAAMWDLTDDVIYQWRTDTLCNFAPLIYYDESPTPVSPKFWSDDAYTDSATWTGDVLGLPTPRGYGKFFDRTAKEYEVIASVMTLKYHGQFAPDWCPHATKWTDVNAASTLPSGAWALYFSGRLMKCIWAETYLWTKPSHNFARPCGGDDSSAIDQTTATCVDGVLTGDLRWPDAVTCPQPTESGYEWNDAGQKGDYILKTWTFDYRDDALDGGLRPVTGPLKTFTAEQECIGHDYQHPNVLIISPINYGFSVQKWHTAPDLTCDEHYGSRWQSSVTQWMQDPLWQAPARPCDLDMGIAWQEDDGTCKADTELVHYYPLRPYEEARVAVPAGAPAYPSGLGVKYTDYIDDRNGGDPSIPECEPPANNGCTFPVWSIQINQEANCCGQLQGVDEWDCYGQEAEP